MDSLIDAMQNVELASMEMEMEPFLEALLKYYDLDHHKKAFEKLGIFSTLALKDAKVLPYCEDMLEWRKIHRIMWLLRVQPDFVTDRTAGFSTIYEWWPKEEDWVLNHSGTFYVHVSAL